MNRRPLVLVVDDEPINIDILYETLHRHYRVQASLEGDLALDIILATSEELFDTMAPQYERPGITGLGRRCT